MTDKHYNKDYFDWQKNVGAFGGHANLFKFEKFIKESDSVIDFGCGGGFLLANIKCKEKIGIEINETARETANKNGIKAVASAEEVEDGWADIIISNHALEHTFRPLDELKFLYPKLKDSGKIIFVLPHERKWDYKPNDTNQHLYTWSPMCAGNLFATAGYNVLSVETIKHTWPPAYYKIRKIFGRKGFDFFSRIYARISSSVYQVRVIAEKKK